MRVKSSGIAPGSAKVANARPPQMSRSSPGGGGGGVGAAGID